MSSPVSVSIKFTGENFEDILVYFLHSIHDKNDEDEVLWDLAKNCISKLGLPDCVVYVLDHKKDELVQKSAHGGKNPKDKEILNRVLIKLGEGITGHVAKTGIAEMIPDTSKDDRYIIDDQARLSEICVPIMYNHEVLGVIDCEHHEKNYFTEQHLRMLSAIASIGGIKINSIRKDLRAKEELERTVEIQKEMADLKIKAFRSQMNPHFIFNALSSIQFFITSEKKKSALEYLSVFSKLIRFYLKHIEHDKVLLSDEITMLNWYLKLQDLRYKNRFAFELQEDNASESMNVMIPSFLLQTLFENIIEHLMSNQIEDCRLYMNYALDGEKVNIQIKYEFENQSSVMLLNVPEYRARMIRWQDQIRQLNSLNSYTIKTETENVNNGLRKGSIIKLQLPNLS